MSVCVYIPYVKMNKELYDHMTSVVSNKKKQHIKGKQKEIYDEKRKEKEGISRKRKKKEKSWRSTAGKPSQNRALSRAAPVTYIAPPLLSSPSSPFTKAPLPQVFSPLFIPKHLNSSSLSSLSHLRIPPSRLPSQPPRPPPLRPMCSPRRSKTLKVPASVPAPCYRDRA